MTGILYAHNISVAMTADSRREKIFDFVREFAVKYFRIVPVKAAVHVALRQRQPQKSQISANTPFQKPPKRGS